MSYLFDASSIFDSVAHGKVTKLVKNYTPDIAKYEICNALWKNTALLKTYTPAESSQMLELLLRLFKDMTIFELTSHEKGIYDLSLRSGMPFYDSTYLYYALKAGLTLVTEDMKMQKNAALLGLDYLSIKDF